MQLVVTVESNVKFHLLQEGTNQSIVVNVFRSINHKAEVEDLTEVGEMHKASCGDCGKECEVPFEPKGDKPVYCSECFQSHKRN